MVLEGDAVVEGQLLGRRDAIGVWDINAVELEAQSNCSLLLIEVPMHW